MTELLMVIGIVIIMAWLIAVCGLDQKKSNLLLIIGGIVCIALFLYTLDWQAGLICIIGSIVAAFCFPKGSTMRKKYGIRRTILILCIFSFFLLVWLVDIIPRLE